MKELVQRTMRCPLEELAATVTVRTDPDGYPSRRHLDVTACSLRPSTSWVPSVRRAYFTDLAPLTSYICDVAANSCHSQEVACAKRCLRVLNAAEPGAAEPVRCTSGVSDGLELARQTLSPTVMRPLWFYGL
jgi:hypothetical protein